MKLYRVLCVIIAILLLSLNDFARAEFTVDATKNAIIHNNKGVNYLKEGNYNAAIASFDIALGLNHNSEASATIYNNLGSAYMRAGQYKLAQTCFESALRFAPMNFSYYTNLVSAYEKQNLLAQKLYEANKTENTDQVLDGLIMIRMGDIDGGYFLLQDFAQMQPKLILTGAIKEYLRNSGQDL